MAKIVSGCCGKDVIEWHGVKICKECGYSPCGEKEVTECCGAEIMVHQPPPDHHPEHGPPDSIESCDKCGRKME